MDLPRSTSQAGIRPSRRSFPNLQHLSLAPLSSRFPIDGDDAPSPSPSDRAPRPSYITGASAPTTPAILTRSPSAHRKPRSKPYQHEGHVPARAPTAITKAKSTSILPMPGRPHPPGADAGAARPPAPLKPASLTPGPAPSHPRAPSDDEWLHRAGLAIASATRSSKGQAWLAQRASSTSLAPLADPAADGRDDDGGGGGGGGGARTGVALLSGEHFADDEYSPATPRWGSRFASRAASARTSRRGSMVGRRGEAMAGGAAEAAADAAAEALGRLDADALAGPDFVGVDEEGGGDDEEEIARLARERGFGLGGLVDRLMGWTLFSVDEDREESEGEDDERQERLAESREEGATRSEPDAKRRREERERFVAPLMADARAREDLADALAAGDEQGGWQDAAWLLSVASKALLGA